MSRLEEYQSDCTVHIAVKGRHINEELAEGTIHDQIQDFEHELKKLVLQYSDIRLIVDTYGHAVNIDDTRQVVRHG